jgi:YgjP-like, metallopeptidase domain
VHVRNVDRNAIGLNEDWEGNNAAFSCPAFNKNRIYVMGQRTKWGNCSALRNLSFNWRLVMAPDFVLRYIATHEMVHLAVPNHSRKFWLTVQSLCPEMGEVETVAVQASS